MGVEQREAARKRRTRREMALARRGLAYALLWTFALVEGSPHADPSGKETAPNSSKTTAAVRLPSHTRGDTGRVADPRNLHGDSKIENANANSSAGEHAVRPIPPALRASDLGDSTEPPPFQFAPTDPAPNYLPPSSAVWSAPPMPWAGTLNPQPSPPRPTPIDAGNAPDVLETTGGPGSRTDSISKSRPARPGPVPQEEQPIKPVEPEVPTMLDLVRAEIRSRLPYFQVCADSARRRAGIEMRRLQATWLINADGTIKEFRLDEVPDKPLAACLIRAGSRPFSVQPGMDLAIPTPIVFVR